ncbi:MAG TPA: hypothetical protein PLK41_08650 [Defluviitoga tunisiensis]|uniref:Uncharacterized protein n=1 Tax=Defluviitoga tunisiensis TaxID=1006576 RepID=A0A0C7NXI0_DEFTU|nr:hypothetical protein [Defluviitoga tunisiensis]MDY0380356.1 hypothetical protein [Defluviitoga tunisiensis]CEP78068.1 hypothetical protein DTL3_0758 [Defluviitoga tunisiensis]HOK17037.1 hypothetical protein [Defluviitoga tunisiensis]HOL87540.1 hypothetical protein [Defluviitoga tunisiensis]HPP11044.1 hypothetical protein [Defluviitoga tunisiensis]
MFKLYLAYYLEVLSDSQLETISKLKFETYERDGINKFRKEINSKKETYNVLKIFKIFEIVPGYAVQKEDIYYDFDEESREKNDLIISELGQDFLIFLLTLLENEKDSILKARENIGSMLESLSYDYMVQISLWNKYGFARLYIKQGEKDLGFIDLINRWYKTEQEYKIFFEDLLKDNRVNKLSSYFTRKEGYVKIS